MLVNPTDSTSTYPKSAPAILCIFTIWKNSCQRDSSSLAFHFRSYQFALFTLSFENLHSKSHVWGKERFCRQNKEHLIFNIIIFEIYKSNVFSKLLQNLQEKTCGEVSLLVYWKKASAKVLFCEFCKIVKNTFFHRTLPGSCFWMCIKIFCQSFAYLFSDQYVSLR